MIPSLSQETLTQYASDAQTIQEPTGADYSRGVSVGRTIPAKWWNWLFSNATKRIVQSRNDADNMLTEMKNVVTDAGLTPSGSDNTQLKQAVEAKTNAQIGTYIEDKKGYFINWTGTPVTLDVPSSVDHIDCTGGYFGKVAATIGYRHNSFGTNSELYVSLTKDGMSWSPTAKLTLSTPICLARAHDLSVFEFKGRYFLFASATNSPDWQYTVYAYLFVTDDLINWELVRKVSLASSTSAVAVNDCAPQIGTDGKALYLITREGVYLSSTQHLYKSTDGVGWTEVTSGFDYSGKPQSHNLITVGNGFYWGRYMFDGASITRAYTSNANTDANPIVFSSGKAIYATGWAVDTPGGVPQSISLPHNYYFNAAQMLLGGAKAAVTVNYAYPGTKVNAVYIIDDALNETELSVPGVESGAYMPFERDGVVYSGNQKSTDLVNWTAVEGMPEGGQGLTPAKAPGVFYCSTSNPTVIYVSVNNLQSWTSVAAKRLGAVMFDDRCWGNYYGTSSGGEVTMNQINRVIGHTLYLR